MPFPLSCRQMHGGLQHKTNIATYARTLSAHGTLQLHANSPSVTLTLLASPPSTHALTSFAFPTAATDGDVLLRTASHDHCHQYRSTHRCRYCGSETGDMQASEQHVQQRLLRAVHSLNPLSFDVPFPRTPSEYPHIELTYISRN